MESGFPVYAVADNGIFTGYIVCRSEVLVEYLRSLASFKAIIDLPVQKIRDILSEHANGGGIDLPKEYGMFICR